MLECPKVYDKCVWCNNKFIREDLHDHELKCGSEVISCQKCEWPVARKDLSKHELDICEEALLSCTNKTCTKMIKRIDLSAHRKECPETVLRCVNTCKELILRKNYKTDSNGEHDCFEYLKMELSNLN